MPLIRLNRNPTHRQLLVFAGAWAVAGGTLALSTHLKGHDGAAAGFGILAALMPIAVLAAHPLVRWVFVGLSYATYPIGFVVSHIALAILYYGVFTPIGLAMRALGRDPLQRRFEANASTYWMPRAKFPSPTRYFRQS